MRCFYVLFKIKNPSLLAKKNENAQNVAYSETKNIFGGGGCPTAGRLWRPCLKRTLPLSEIVRQCDECNDKKIPELPVIG